MFFFSVESSVKYSLIRKNQSKFTLFTAVVFYLTSLLLGNISLGIKINFLGTFLSVSYRGSIYLFFFHLMFEIFVSVILFYCLVYCF